MDYVLRVNNLSKTFKDFSLKNISFDVPAGSVVGMVGENGSGKSTCIRCILGQDVYAHGSIELFGKNARDNIESHSRIGTASDICPFPDSFSARQVSSVLNDIYSDWDEQHFFELLKSFDLPPEKAIKKMSRGMKVKLCLASALSHESDLLILDEATAGLDPVVREEILDLLMSYMEKESRSIFMTSHITSDLERIADYILYIQNGEILFMEEKSVLESSGIAHVKADQIAYIDPSLVVRVRKQPLCTDLLIKDRREFARRYPDYVIEPAKIDDVILMYSKGVSL